MATAASSVAAGTSAERRSPSLFFSTATVGIATAIARVAGAGKTALIATFFRPGTELDAYLLAFLIVSSINEVFFGSLGAILVPSLIGEATSDGRAKNEAYARALVASLTGAAVLATLLAGAALTAGFTRLTYILLPMIPLTALAGVWRSVLNARFQFGAASLSFVLTPIIASAFLIGAHSVGVMVLAVGSAVGILGEAIFLGIVLLRAGIPLFPVNPATTESAFRVSTQYASLVASGLVARGALIVDQLAATWTGAGGLSVLNFSTRIPAMLVAVGPGALSTTILPRFSQCIAAGNGAGARRLLLRNLAFSMSSMALLSGLMIAFSHPIAALAFSHGAFTPADLQRVVMAQRWSFAQAPFDVGLAIVIPLVASLRANHSVVPLWAVALIFHVVLNYLLVARFGVSGILCVSAIIQAVVFGCALAIVFRRLRLPQS